MRALQRTRLDMESRIQEKQPQVLGLLRQRMGDDPMTIPFPRWVKRPTSCTQESKTHIEHTRHGAIKTIKTEKKDTK